ncbi:hypothetical protein KSS87_009510 [Heliosperma pusillum]|nr:hypothetical protein KSS87_009510 [Heliosperma pusillum]
MLHTEKEEDGVPLMTREEETQKKILKLQLSQKEADSRGPISAFNYESKKLWHIAGPAIFTAISQYSMGALTQTFAGQIGELELAAVSMENSVIAGLAFGVMLGMGSALETLCGQAFGAGKHKMLGIYMQRSWVILLGTACLLTPLYTYSSFILQYCGTTKEISDAAAGVLVLHTALSWLLMLRLGYGLAGAAIMLNISWWLIVILQLLYIIYTKSDGAWSGLSWLAFADLWGFVKLSVASAVMLCLELWYLMMLVVIVGVLPNPLIPVDAVSICMNLQGWDAMIAIGFNAAISVRVSNELGAGNYRQAKISVTVVSITSVAIGFLVFLLVLATRDTFPLLFTNSEAVAKETTRISIVLAFTVLLNSLQPVLSGVAIGAGWQSLVAYINIACYYLVGLPAGIILGFTYDYGVMGVWGGMVGGICLQTAILIAVTALTNWKKEAAEAESRVRLWGGAAADE